VDYRADGLRVNVKLPLPATSKLATSKTSAKKA
jgi:hypothetical protein